MADYVFINKHIWKKKISNFSPFCLYLNYKMDILHRTHIMQVNNTKSTKWYSDKVFCSTVTTVQYKWIQYCLFLFYWNHLYLALDHKMLLKWNVRLTYLITYLNWTIIIPPEVIIHPPVKATASRGVFRPAGTGMVNVKQNGSSKELNRTKTQWGLVDAAVARYQCHCLVLVVVSPSSQ